MGDFVAASNEISPLVAILWVFYPMGALVLIELILRAINPDDDDDTDPPDTPSAAYGVRQAINN